MTAMYRIFDSCDSANRERDIRSAQHENLERTDRRQLCETGKKERELYYLPFLKARIGHNLSMQKCTVPLSR